MAAIAFCTGPCHVAVAFRDGNLNSSGAALYLGTCEDTPSSVLRPSFGTVVNSVSGGVAYDLSFQGEEAFIGLDLTRYDAVTLLGVRARARRSGAGAAPTGQYAAGDLGTLPLTEGLALVLYLLFPYAAKPVFRAQGMPLGYRFPFTVPIGPDDLGPQGTKARKERVMFHCLAAYNFVTGGHLLYDEDMGQFPVIS